MKKYDLISSSICFIFGLLIVLYAPEFGLGTMKTPGSGFMPFFSGLLICGFSAITFFRSLLDKSTKVEKVWAGVNFHKLIFIILGLLLYIVLLEKLGFIICSFLLMLMTLRYVGSQSWPTSILVSIFSSISVYVLFEVWLGVLFPRGILSFLAF